MRFLVGLPILIPLFDRIGIRQKIEQTAIDRVVAKIPDRYLGIRNIGKPACKRSRGIERETVEDTDFRNSNRHTTGPVQDGGNIRQIYPRAVVSPEHASGVQSKIEHTHQREYPSNKGSGSGYSPGNQDYAPDERRQDISGRKGMRDEFTESETHQRQHCK